MGFLNPLLLLASAALAVPIILHLFHRREGRRLSFPALRYLLRTEREHARRIRFRQLLLFLLRSVVILLLVLAGARPFLEGEGGAHAPTALAIVIDNSLSTGRVIGDARVLDQLKGAALAALERAGGEDRIWVVRAAEPWDVATPGGVEDAHDRITATATSAAAADLPAAVRRAAALVQQAGMPAAEVHLLTDLQATALPPGRAQAGNVPLLVFHPTASPPLNRYLGSILVGGGLPPLAGRRSELVVGVAGDTAEAPLRLVAEGRIRGATRVAGGDVATLPIGPFPAGWISGYVETDPDKLSADDRRWFTLFVRPPPLVSVRGQAFFLEQALAVLEDAGRLGRDDARPDVVVAVAGEGAQAVRGGSTVVVIPPSEPALLPALNRRLAEAGIPWRYEISDAQGETRVAEHRIPVPLEEVRVSGGYQLVGAQGSPGVEVLARLEDGSPWLVAGSGTGPTGSYRLLGSALDPAVTDLPVSAFMVPLLEWLVSPPGGEARRPTVAAGTPFALPGSATAIETPSGLRQAVDGAQDFRATREAGIYRVLAGDSLLDLVAVNPPLRESLLEPADGSGVEQALGPEARLVADSAAWVDAVFVSHLGEELWRPLLLLALLLLIVESWVASTAASDARSRRGTPEPAPVSGR